MLRLAVGASFCVIFVSRILCSPPVGLIRYDLMPSRHGRLDSLVHYWVSDSFRQGVSFLAVSIGKIVLLCSPIIFLLLSLSLDAGEPASDRNSLSLWHRNQRRLDDTNIANKVFRCLDPLQEAILKELKSLREEAENVRSRRLP